jgi:hypothetical protein
MKLFDYAIIGLCFVIGYTVHGIELVLEGCQRLQRQVTHLSLFQT